MSRAAGIDEATQLVHDLQQGASTADELSVRISRLRGFTPDSDEAAAPDGLAKLLGEIGPVDGLLNLSPFQLDADSSLKPAWQQAASGMYNLGIFADHSVVAPGQQLLSPTTVGWLSKGYAGIAHRLRRTADGLDQVIRDHTPPPDRVN
jgi:hypothetical protein